MREMICKIAGIVSVVCAIGMVTSAVYAGVIFVGDTENVGFKSAQKVMPAVDFTCQNGQDWYNGKCVAKCDRTTYPQAVALDETKGTIASCTDAWGTYYIYTSCHNGWDLIEGDCIETDCSNFSYTSAPESIAGTVTSCKSGLSTFYKYLSCNEGWDFANGKCTVHTCSSTTYPYTTNPSSDARTIVSCKTGAATQYGYSECRTGWDKSNGYCNIHVCDSNAFPFTSQPSNSIGTVASCKTGNDVKYGYSACSNDYELKNGQCEIKCTYTATSKPTGCATVTDSCVKNGTTYYAATCTACDSGYTLSDGSCTACSWSGYTLASCPFGATCSSNMCGGVKKYTAISCGIGFKLSEGTCEPYSVGDVVSYNETPIGVVFDTYNSGYGLKIIALRNTTYNSRASYLESGVQWAASPPINIPEITVNNATVNQDMNGKSNTDKIVVYEETPAGHQARSYAPSVCGNESFCAMGQWYLPAGGEWRLIWNHKDIINSALKNISGQTLECDQFSLGRTYFYYWASNLYSAYEAFVLLCSSGNLVHHHVQSSKYSSSSSSAPIYYTYKIYAVRPSLQIDLCEINGSEYDSETEQCQ